MMHNGLQTRIYMTLKEGDLVVLHNDNINHIYYKLELNIYMAVILLC